MIFKRAMAVVALTACYQHVALAKVPQATYPDPVNGCSGLKEPKLTACVMAIMQQQQREEREESLRRQEAELEKLREKKRVAAEQRAKAEAWARESALAMAEEEKLPQTHADRIKGLKGRIVYLQGVIAREDRILASSGVTNKATRYQAGQAIEFAREQIAKEYQKYRNTGGRRPLSAL